MFCLLFGLLVRVLFGVRLAAGGLWFVVCGLSHTSLRLERLFLFSGVACVMGFGVGIDLSSACNLVANKLCLLFLPEQCCDVKSYKVAFAMLLFAESDLA